MNSVIELLKLYNGELIIGKFDCLSKDDKIVLKDPRIIFMVPTRTGEMMAVVRPVTFPFESKRLKDTMEFPTSQIEFRLFDKLGEIDKDLIDGYNSEVAGITIASTADMNAMTGNNSGSLIL